MRGPFLKIASAKCRYVTGAAISVKIAGREGAVWIPQSQIHGDLIITQWIAEQKGIEDEGSEYEP